MAGSKYIVIIGCGRLGSHLADFLSEQGHSVVVVDRDEAAFEQLSPEFSGFKQRGDASRIPVLCQCKLGKADWVIAATGDDNVNLMVAQVARRLFNVSRVMARVFEPKREEMFRDMGIEIVNPARVTAERFLQLLSEPERKAACQA